MKLFRRRDDEDFDKELQAHLELEAKEKQASGLSREEAHYAARRGFGNAAIVKEDVRAVWNWVWLERFVRDIKHGARGLRKNPGFTIIAVLTLVLGIGANTAIFSALDALMLQPLPFMNSDQLVRIYSTKNGVPITGFAYPGGPSGPDLRDFEQDTHSFQMVVGSDSWRKNVSFGDAGGEPEERIVGLVPAKYFELLSVRPLLGRLFTEDEGQPGKNFVAAISARLWRDRFGSDKAILGRQIRINEESYTIVAVMPDVIAEWMEERPGRIEIWTPFTDAGAWAESNRGGRGFSALARMKPGVSLEQAQADIATVAGQLAATHAVDEGVGVVIKRVADTRVGTLRPMLFLLAGAVGLILLIACVNLANLLLARNAARQRELAMRAALGAGRFGLVGGLLAETLLLSLAGGTGGLILAQVGLTSFARMNAQVRPRLESLGMDWRVLVFTLVVSVATSLLFGLAPAYMGTKLNLVDALKEGGRSGASARSSHRLRSILVVTEMAMSLMLLVGAGLLIRSILRLERQNLGIREDHLLRGHLYLPPVRYPDTTAITRFSDDFGARVRALPGASDATVTTIYPPYNGWTQMLGLPGSPATRIQDIPTAQFGVADAHFLKTLGIPLLRGRDFAESDGPNTPSVALISEEFRRRYFPAEDPVGQRVHIGPPDFLRLPRGEDVSDDANVTVIGVIGDFKNVGLTLAPEPQITVLYAQHPLVNYGFKDILVRTAADPRVLEPAIAAQLHQMDADMPFAEAKTMAELVEDRTGEQRFTTVLLALFAAAGLALASVGIYGVVSFLGTQRRQELAVRMALGASRSNILQLLLKQGLGMAVTGAGLGLCGAWAAQRLTIGILFGISPLDPISFAAGAAFLLTIAAIACAIPGARAMRIEPATALRQD